MRDQLSEQHELQEIMRVSENSMSCPVTAVVITKNEGRALTRCLQALAFCDQVIVIDSASTDSTLEIAERAGVEIVQFEWNGHYPKKKQWGMSHPSVRHDWVLHVDGDEVVPRELALEINRAVTDGGKVAFDIPINYHFAGKRLHHGHRVYKRALVDRRHARFPEVGDLSAPGITEVEGHYQPIVSGEVGTLTSRLTHDDPDPVSDWIARHNRYSDWEAFLLRNRAVRHAVRQQRTRGGQTFDRLPAKPFVFFLYSYILKRGFLDGRAGFDYAFGLAWYYWAIGLKNRDFHQRAETS